MPSRPASSSTSTSSAGRDSRRGSMSEALRALLSGLIDYAGLFPPASLDLPAAMRNYTAYRKGPHAWMLGRFVVPDTLAKEVDSEFPLSVLTSDKKKEQA